jgi:hypothetical protein
MDIVIPAMVSRRLRVIINSLGFKSAIYILKLIKELFVKFSMPDFKQVASKPISQEQLHH